MSKPLTQADYVMTPENARDRALLIAAQDADAPKLTDRLDAEAMRVLVATLDEIRAALAAAEAKLEQWEEREAACCPEDFGFPEVIASLRSALADERKHADALYDTLMLRHNGDSAFWPNALFMEQHHAARRASEVGNG